MKLNMDFYQGQINNKQSEQKNIGLFQGKISGVSKTEAGKLDGTSIYAGNVNLENDPIAERKALAQKRAMKVVMDTYAKDSELDDKIVEHKSNAQGYFAEAKEAEEQVRQIKETKDELKKVCTPKEYEESCGDFDEMEQIWEGRANQAINQAIGENQAVRGIKLARLKSNPMVKASNKAEDILEVANKEAINSILDEAKETMDNKMEESKEESEKLKEEKKEEEEKIESKSHNKIENNQVTPENSEKIQNADIMQDEVQKQIKNIMDDQKLLEEDLKGIKIDESM